ncbi:hypothetical protein [Rhodoplanes roseus]|nr:hypothetical protein [Rhodoplanes roseus]
MGRNAKKELIQQGYLDNVPDRFRPLFSVVPVFQADSLDDYGILILQAIETIRPTRFTEWVAVKDYVDVTWEIAQYRRVRTSIIDAAVNELVSDLAQAHDGSIPRFGKQHYIPAETMTYDTARFRALVAKLGVSPDLLIGQAFLRRAPELQRIDLLIAVREKALQSILQGLYLGREHALTMAKMREGNGGRALPPPAGAIEPDGASDTNEAA